MIATLTAKKQQTKMNLFVKFIIANLAVCLVQSAVVHEKCNMICTKEYNPVCGLDNTGNSKTFSNKCTFEYEQCENRGAEWRLIAESECDNTKTTTCTDFCTMEYRPVCGMDNTGRRVTFGNKCIFESEQCNNRGADWKLTTESACEDQQQDSIEECATFCPLIYQPVCGMDNTGNRKTFGNECHFKQQQCNNRGSEWRIVKQDTCESDVQSKTSEVCPAFCTLEYMPVCGMDNTGNQRTFGNKCTFEVEQCNNRGAEWKIIQHSECTYVDSVVSTCSKPCTREYKPVCGLDNTGNKQLFSNKCMFENEQCENRGAEWRMVSLLKCIEQSTNDDLECPQICPLSYRPLCAMDNTGNTKTFSNECYFKAEQCENRGAEWRVINNQDCRLRSAPKTECPKKCTREYMPVCGVDNTGNFRTFNNECEFKTEECENRGAEWKLVAKQDCRLRETDDQQCPLVCPLLLSPVCGMDNTGNQRTFDNECVFKKEQCENRGAEWRIVSNQDCRLRRSVRSVSKAECPKVCPLLLSPVCGMDNTGNMRTFDNECEFKKEECENRGAEWKLVAKQDCRLREADDQQCPSVCPLLLSPVCGMDNTGNQRTFDNECVFKKEQCENRGAEWRIIANQDCRLRSNADEQCPMMCPMILAPVCGMDNTGNFKTFSNECFFKSTQCENRGAEWRIVSQQDCRLRN
ncbi:agrin-like isoform X2 [Chrysoperla carnea]|uniref:agrin-like isoform X2 n=1 Tax=Chrysoperla carnea TaxID=189513 RepID=UPI001D0919D9|nr:agrin-like isoform X2 [Chrysoperla carnea]